MHAYLITGGSASTRADALESLLISWKAGAFDRIPLLRDATADSIGIEALVAWQKRLMYAPVASPVTAGIIAEANLLTPEAQNALLKTLEEPPPRVRIVLVSDSVSLLIPTVVSRVTVLYAHGARYDAAVHAEALSVLAAVLDPALSAGEAIVAVDAVVADRDRKQLKALVVQAMSAIRTRLLSDGTSATTDAKILRKLMRAYDMLDANVNVKLAMDALRF